jgi:hypothetical protein
MASASANDHELPGTHSDSTERAAPLQTTGAVLQVTVAKGFAK